jgi:hypothetical protein
MRSPRAALCLVSLLSVLATLPACAAPPRKEMDQAQGAIDAARAAGASAFATAELQGAVDALAQADAAVAARDYRLALNHALDSRDRAQAAARSAVDARARARGDAERVLAQAATLIDRLAARIKDAQAARLPRRSLAGPVDTLAMATKSLQEARAALVQENYGAVATMLDGVAARVQAALQALDAAVAGGNRGRAR